MSSGPDITSLALGVLALGAVGFVLAKLLALAGIPGGVRSAGVLGGAAAGLLLGTGVLGGVAPETHARWWLGDTQQREALDELQARQRADLAALRLSDVSPIAIDEQADVHAAERRPLEAALAEARKRHATRIGLIAGAALLASLLLAGAASGRRRGVRDGDGDIAVAAGLSSVVVATLSAGVIALWLMPFGLRESLAFGAAGAIGGTAFSGRFVLSSGGRHVRVRQSAAAAALVGAALVAGSGQGGLLATSVLIAVAASLAAQFVLHCGARARRRLEAAAFVGVGPIVVGLALVQVDPATLAGDRAFWIGAIASALLHHDGRWFGAWLPWRMFGDARAQASSWRRSSALLESGVGLTQCGAATVLVYAGVLPASLAAGLVVSAIVIEMTEPVRERAAGWMDDLLSPSGAAAE